MIKTPNHITAPNTILGPAGQLQIQLNLPVGIVQGVPAAIAVIAHPHPQMGGTMHNKVVHTLANLLAAQGFVAIRFNFRGVELSEGLYDQGLGEVADYLAVLHWAKDFFKAPCFWAGGFSFGSYIAAKAITEAALNPVLAGCELKGTWLIAPPIARMPFADLPALPSPVYVVQGTDDEVVAAEDTYAWCSARAEQVNLLKLDGAGHFFHQRLTDLKNILLPTLPA